MEDNNAYVRYYNKGEQAMFIIIHELPSVDGVRQFKAHPKVHHMEKDAEFAAAETARREKAPAWACEIPTPPRVQDRSLVDNVLDGGNNVA